MHRALRRGGSLYASVWKPWGGCVVNGRANSSSDLLHQHAPTWLVQMPALLSATELEALQRKTARRDAGADVAGVGRSTGSASPLSGR